MKKKINVLIHVIFWCKCSIESLKNNAQVHIRVLYGSMGRMVVSFYFSFPCTPRGVATPR